MLKVILIRHGYSMGNKNHTLSGWHDVVLTEEGIEALQVLQKTYEYPKTDGYYSSDLSRAYDTAKILFPEQAITKLADFREIHFGIYEGWGFDRIDHDQFFSDWLEGIELEEGESFLQFRNRVLCGLENLGKKMADSSQDSATLVCHSGVIRMLVTLCCENPLEELFDVPVINGLGYELSMEWEEGKLKMKAIEKLKTPEMMGEDLIMQLDDDELIRPNHIARFAEIFEAHPEYGIVTAPYEKDGTTRILGADPLPTWRKTSSMDADLERLLSAGNCQQAVFGFGGNLCLRTSVARQALYPRRVPRGEDFSFLLACRLLYANGAMTAGLASGDSRFLTWFCPERAVTILHHPPAEEKVNFLQSFEINLKRFILERQMLATQEGFTWEDLAGQSQYLAAMFGQEDFYHQIKLWIQEIRDYRTDIPDPEWIDALESRLFAFLEEAEKELRWQNYLRDRRKFEEAQKILEKLEVKEKLIQARGWQT